jgi:hypothetical protein
MPDTPVTLGLQASFGFGDRLGNATPGHVASMQRCGAGIAPIYPQQSIREMARTDRQPDGVMADACNGAADAGWTAPFGADADHLKTEDDVDRTGAAGFTFFTIDPSDNVDQQADDYDEATVNAKFAEIADDVPWMDNYLGNTVTLSTGASIDFTEAVCRRAAVKYGKAISHAIELGAYIAKVQTEAGRDYEIELSVDETEQPTTLAEHYIIASECIRAGMKLVSLAPRFIGHFEKGVDFKGDLEVLEQSLADHAAIADAIGPYKLSLHSGSDKLSMYTPFARATSGRFHVKTAGTSYLEALRVVAIHDEALFREIVDFSRGRYETDRATYHVSATLDDAPEVEGATLEELVDQYLERWEDVPQGIGFTRPGRQILHCTFGSVLTHPKYGPAVKNCLDANLDTYTKVLDEHFGRHLDALRAGME